MGEWDNGSIDARYQRLALSLQFIALGKHEGPLALADVALQYGLSLWDVPQELVNGRDPVGAAKALGVNRYAAVGGRESGAAILSDAQGRCRGSRCRVQKKVGAPKIAHPEWESEEMDAFFGPEYATIYLRPTGL